MLHVPTSRASMVTMMFGFVGVFVFSWGMLVIPFFTCVFYLAMIMVWIFPLKVFDRAIDVAAYPIVFYVRVIQRLSDGICIFEDTVRYVWDVSDVVEAFYEHHIPTDVIREVLDYDEIYGPNFRYETSLHERRRRWEAHAIVFGDVAGKTCLSHAAVAENCDVEEKPSEELNEVAVSVMVS